jgi:lipopolysaccharide exporter
VGSQTGYFNMLNDMANSLTSKVAKSAGWVFSAKILGRLFDIVKIVVLARLLSPEDFGLFGLVMLIMIMFETFSQTGLKAALVQHKGNTNEYLDNAWTIQVVRGVIISLILLLVAPLAAWFFNEPRIILPLKVMCLSFIVQGFINIETIYFEKDLKFKKQFYYDMTGNAVSLLTGILLAYLLRSVWALIWANLAGVFTRLILSYAMLKYKPRFQFIRSQSQELFHFGKWMSGYAIALFGWQQLDKFFVGKLLGPIPLGIYQIAQRISDIPISNIAGASVNFTFPAYSKIQQESERLGKAFLDVFETLMSVVLPIIVFFVLAAPDIVYGLLTEKWKDSIIPLQILSIAGFFTALDTLSTPLFISVGKPNIEFYKNLLKVTVLLVTIYPFTIWWGLVGSCMSLVVSSVAVLPVWASIRSIANIRWADIFSRLLFPCVCAVTTALSVLTTHVLIRDFGILSLVISASLSLLLFVCLTIFLGKFYNTGLYIYIRRALTSA